MNPSLLNALVYSLGFIGLASIGLLPVRVWQLLSAVRKVGLRSIRNLLMTFVIPVAGAVLWSDLQVAIRVFGCLVGPRCGPNVASGWTYLAILGVVYMAFELIACAVRGVVQLRFRG